MVMKKKSESNELTKLMQLYAFISQVNQNIVRIKDETTLFKNSCDIALEFGKFKMAWIGIFDTEHERINLIDQSGVPAEVVKLFTNYPIQRNSPLDHVLKTGLNYISNDVLNNPELENWKQFAIKYNIGSCMVLPIKRSGLIVGTLNLYSCELDFSNKAETKLLDEIAKDISFALDLFKKETVYRDTQKLLIQNEKYFRTLIEKSADMITLLTKEGKFIYGSPSIIRVLGYTIEELLKLSVFDIIHPDDISKTVEGINKILTIPGSSFDYQPRRRHKNGTWVFCEGSITNMLHEPGIHALVSNFRDISEKKAIEELQEFDKNNLDALINSTNDLMWSVDRDCKLITFNQPFYNIIKLVSGKMVSKGDDVFSVVLSPEQFDRFSVLYDRAFAGESFTEIEYITSPVESWSEISYYPIRKGDEVMGTACYSRDITKIKKAEQLVVINENRYRALVENGADAVVILSAEGKPVYVSPTLERVLGYTEAEALQLDMFSMFHPNDIEWAVKVWEQVLNNPGVPFPVNASRMIHKDGTWRWLEGTLTNLLQDPAVNGIVDNFRDVTGKKRAEEELLLTQFAIDNAGDAVFWMTPDARIFKVNEAACLMLGYSQQEMLKLTVPDIDPDFNAEKWRTHYKELRRKGSLFFETIQQAKDGRLIPVEIRANYIKFGEEEFNCAFCRDISERKIAEETLKQSESRLKDAQAIAHIGNFEVDLKDYSEVWSDEMYEIYGIAKEGFIPSKELFLSFIHPDDRDSVAAEMDECLTTFESSSTDFRFIREDGIMRYGCSEARFELDKNRKLIRIYGILQDVTGNKLAEIERTKLVSDMLIRNMELEQFGYIISHNLRAPVANIIGASNALKDPELSIGDKETLNNGINESVIKLDAVVQDLNHILEVKGEIDETKEIVRFSALVEDIRASIRNLIDKENIEIKCDFSERDEFFTLRPYLYSIFYNLISNSIKYRRPQVHTIIEIKSRMVKNKIELFFTDNGKGIDIKKNGDKVFGLYKRFHTDIEGKGMGLFMVKTQVELLGGKISIKSLENEGAQFKIEL
jgi:PAS domain S-box-containing protein